MYRVPTSERHKKRYKIILTLLVFWLFAIVGIIIVCLLYFAFQDDSLKMGDLFGEYIQSKLRIIDVIVYFVLLFKTIDTAVNCREEACYKRMLKVVGIFTFYVFVTSPLDTMVYRFLTGYP